MSELLQEIHVTENDGDDRFRTGSTSNGVYAHAQKMVKMAVNAFSSSKFSTLIRSLDCWIKWRCQKCGQTLENCVSAYMCTKIWQKNKTLLNRQNFSTDHTKYVAENDGDNRFQIGSRNYAFFCACAKKIRQHGCKWSKYILLIQMEQRSIK